MTPHQLKPGDLIRYDATTSQWHLGIVRRVDASMVELEFFWGTREDVSLAQVTLFRNHLESRQRRLSLKRTDLCTAFFNNPLYRLREERVRTIQETLRQHGLAFTPNVWQTPDTRIKIWNDDSVVLNKKPLRDTKFEALLPRWLEVLKLPPSSRDPLGLQSHAERLANELLPGMTVFTSRIGYYGLLAWAIQFVNKETTRPGETRYERLYRLERALVLCEFVHHGAGNNTCRLLGQRSKTEVLQSADGNRYRVPKRILKNQVSAGAYRIYFSSMKSFGFAQDAFDLGAEDMLPLTLTHLGERLARVFELRLNKKFSDFCLSDRLLDRDTIRSWGARVCFSELGNLGRYREQLLEGMLRGNSPEAEKRCRTVKRLFQQGLLNGSYDDDGKESAAEVVAEEDARTAEEVPAVSGLENDTVLLHFYEQLPQPENRDFQVAATFELLSLGLSALFQLIVEELWKVGRSTPADLATRFAADSQLGPLWTLPLNQCSSRAPKARGLVKRLMAADEALLRAALGGVLLARIFGDRCFIAVAGDLSGTPALMLCDEVLRSKPERTLADAFPELIVAMVEWHQTVSTNKNRQRWCFLDGDAVVKDDLQQMQTGFHAFRFPQLFSLCRDLSLQEEDIQYGD